jgi:hypothetical protein
VANLSRIQCLIDNMRRHPKEMAQFRSHALRRSTELHRNVMDIVSKSISLCDVLLDLPYVGEETERRIVEVGKEAKRLRREIEADWQAFDRFYLDFWEVEFFTEPAMLSANDDEYLDLAERKLAWLRSAH